jgi:antitoxin component YwqK of YwqJK toxin-antitoxin module
MQEKILKHKDLILPPNSKATYVKQTMKPAEGIVIERYSNGNIKTEVVYDDGYVVKVKNGTIVANLKKIVSLKKTIQDILLTVWGFSN